MLCRLIADHFNIYTREAGAGTLSVAIEGPGQAKMKVEERPHGFLGVSFNVDKPGRVLLTFSFNLLLITNRRI